MAVVLLQQFDVLLGVDYVCAKLDFGLFFSFAEFALPGWNDALVMMIRSKCEMLTLPYSVLSVFAAELREVLGSSPLVRNVSMKDPTRPSMR